MIENSRVEKFKIESESEADSYLKDLLSKDEYRTIHVVRERAVRHIPDEQLRAYFIIQGEKILAQ